MELSDKVYNKITKLCAKGDSLIEKGIALDNYYKALELVPEPKDI